MTVRLRQPADQRAMAQRLKLAVADWLARYSISLMRISLGLVFLVFGALKFFGISPAQDLAEQTMAKMSFGLVAGSFAGIWVATTESLVGLSLVTGKQLRLGLALLGLNMIGIFAPLVLFTGRLFSGPDHAPTLEGQYVMKDVVLLAGGLVVAARELGRRPLSPRDEPTPDVDDPARDEPADRSRLSREDDLTHC